MNPTLTSSKPESLALVDFSLGNFREVYVSGVGTAVPPIQYSQKEALEFILDNFQLKESTRRLYERVFSNQSVKSRFFAGESLKDILTEDHDKILERFQNWGVRLSSEALSQAMKDSGVPSEEIDFLAVTTCTGYLCPGLSSYLVETNQLRKNIHHSDLVGMGCGAALPAMEQAYNFIKAHPGATAAVVSTEICSAAFLSRDAGDVIVSNSLFGDGSGAVILKGGLPPTAQNGHGSSPKIVTFESRIYPEWRESLRFKSDSGHLRNVLAKDVPELAGKAAKNLIETVLKKAGLLSGDIHHWILHAGGEKILASMQTALNLDYQDLRPSYSVLENYGNLSSPSVLFVYQQNRQRNRPQPGEWGIIASFGAGFSAHAALMRF